MKSYQQLFAELKRRHVFRVAAIYGAVAFALIQVADPLAKALLLPDVFLTYVAAVLILGFPLALVLAWAFEVTPDGVRKARGASDAEIEAILAQPRSRRWPSGVLALTWIVLLVATAWWAGRSSGLAGTGAEAHEPSRLEDVPATLAEAESDDRPSIAVLPFDDMSPEGDQVYFSDGMTEEILNALTRVRELRVSARTSTFAFRDADLTAEQLGDTLRVHYLVEGSVRKAGDQLRITAQLIDSQDGSHLWSEQYDRELEDVFAIQSEIAESIADALRVPLGLDDPGRLVRPTEDLAAYDLYLTGRALMRERGESLPEAVRMFEAAVARDSTWAPAWAGLAESYTLMPYYEGGSAEAWRESLDAAERAARRALALDPRSSSALVALGSVHRDRWEWADAEDTYLRALELDPDNVEAHQQYGEFLAYVGRMDEAYLSARRAVALDRSPIRLNVVGYIARNNGRYDEAADFLDEGIRLDPEKKLGYLRGNRAWLHFLTDRSAASRERYFEYLAAYNSPDVVAAYERAWPASSPMPTPEVAALETEASVVRGAVMWMTLGDHERAIEAMTRDRPPFGQTDLWWVPFFEPIREDPRMIEAQARWGLEGFELHRLGKAPGE